METRLYTLIILVILGAFGASYVQKESKSCSTIQPTVSANSSAVEME
jgi:hypothetical protein